MIEDVSLETTASNAAASTKPDADDVAAANPSGEVETPEVDGNGDPDGSLPAENAGPEGPNLVKKRRRKRGDGVRERVLTSALDCFSTFGFEGTSTREVAVRAGVTHTLVLYHFQSKDQLWYAAFENALTPYLTAVAPIFEGMENASAAETLGKYIEVFVRQAALRPEIHRILSNEGNSRSDRLDWIIQHFLRDHFKTVCDLIRRGQVEGTVRQCDAARLYYMIMMMGGSLPAIAIEYKELTGRSFTSDPEILRNIAFIYELVFID